MNHPETYTVTLDNGPRPFGNPGECFYCHEPLGSEHTPGCVMRRRTVLVDVTFRLVLDMPERWTDVELALLCDQVGRCRSTYLEKVQALAERVKCLCPFTSLALIGDATADDEIEQKWGLEA